MPPARSYPGYNHYGAELGGATIALLAIRNDPGIDTARIDRFLDKNLIRLRTILDQGFGDGGYFAEHAGPGGIGSDTAFIPALQMLRNAAGEDFIPFDPMCRLSP